jgi:late competence protein required for DNA uptake (superfamily II DNA/RNA helicase)
LENNAKFNTCVSFLYNSNFNKTFKKNKIRYKSIDLLARQEETPVAIMILPNLKISLKFLENYFIVVAPFRFSGSQKKRKRRLIICKTGHQYNSVSHSGRPMP